MNATKRKFNALLNGMGNKSTTSLSSSTKNDSRADLNSTDDADPQKRRRLSDPKQNVHDNSSHPRPTVIARSSAALQHKKSTSLATAALAQDAPKYAPWDRVAFLRRLKSFSSLTDWTPKPARVNEVEWAKRGWVCQKQERVRCCLCNVEILVKLNKKVVDGKEEPVYVAQNIEDALVDKYVELIVESHDESCLWKKRGCDETIFKMPLNHPPTTLQSLRERYEELATRQNTLPYLFNMRTPPDFDIEKIIDYLPKDFLANPIDTSNPPALINRVALIMALFGWQGHEHERLGSQVGSVSCQACFRVLGLWLFKSKEINEAGEETSGAAVSCLDVVKEHRKYCPWRNSISQSGPKTTSSSSEPVAGWEIILRVLKNDSYSRTSKERSAVSASRPSTPQREGTPFMDEIEDADAQSIREEDDKKRWARLRRVKSLFNTKSDRKSVKPAAEIGKAGGG